MFMNPAARPAFNYSLSLVQTFPGYSNRQLRARSSYAIIGLATVPDPTPWKVWGIVQTVT